MNNNQFISMSYKTRPTGSFLSVSPLEPVLIFESPAAASAFQTAHKLGRIYPDTPLWVYLPLPQGLLRARTAKYGDMSWEFEKAYQATNFNREIGYIGTVYPNTMDRPKMDHNVYIGPQQK